MAEGEVAPERGEGEDQLADVVEVALLDQPVGGVQEAIPREHQYTEERECAQPSTHKKPPTVERALEVEREAH